MDVALSTALRAISLSPKDSPFLLAPCNRIHTDQHPQFLSKEKRKPPTNPSNPTDFDMFLMREEDPRSPKHTDSNKARGFLECTKKKYDQNPTTITRCRRLGTVPLQDGQMPKQDLGTRVQTYWIEGRGEESTSPGTGFTPFFLFFWG